MSPQRKAWREGMVRGSWTWCLALALLLVVPLGGACKKKGLRPGEGAAGGAGGGVGGEGRGGASAADRRAPVRSGGAAPLCRDENETCGARTGRVPAVVLGR